MIGQQAVNQKGKNFKNTFMYFTRFAGLNMDNAAQLEYEKMFVNAKMVSLPNKKFGFEITNAGNKEVFTPEQILASFLKLAAVNFRNAGIDENDEIIISIPTYASNTERQAYLDAAEIAGIRCPRLINDSTAVALTYEYQKKSELSVKNARVVAFVDFGHCKTCVSFVSFKQGHIKILRNHFERNLGARNIDWLLYDQFKKEFSKKHGLDLNENPRAKIKMLDAIEKLRKNLTANKEADIVIESLMDD